MAENETKMIEATVLRRFSSGDTAFAKGAVISVPEGQFNDWESVGLVKAGAKPKKTEAAAQPAA